MAKKKKTRRRTPKTMSLYDAAVAWGNLTILTEGTVGSGPIGFITGEYDIQSSTTTGWSTDLVGTTKISGNEQISMRDMLNDPGLSFGQITENVKNNAVGMTVNALVFNAGARILKRAIRNQFRRIALFDLSVLG